MKYLRFLTGLLMMTAVAACDDSKTDRDQNGTGNGGSDDDNKTEVVDKVVFAKGADISWVTQMESQGMKFYNSAGAETECTVLMKETGFDAIRLRVWVNPSDGWCNKNDVLIKAGRARDAGMKLMIDFHYSDTWADPGHQTPPAAWAGYNADQMAEAVAGHTKEVLQLLKDNGIEVTWVQIGNEVNQGMLWDSGKVSDSSVNSFIDYFNSGSKAAKEVYPQSKVILHVSNGHDSGLFTWFFDLMKKHDADYDIIGMSLYPVWWENGAWRTDWQTNATKCMSNTRSISARYGKPVILCEVGMPCGTPQMSKEAMQYILTEAKKIEMCQGVFYWEPQAPDGYNGGYGLGSFANGKPTIALDPFRN